MTLKTELVALAVRLLAENTNLVRKPDAFEETISQLITGETFDKRVARDLVGKTDEVAALVKSLKARRQAKKIQNG